MRGLALHKKIIADLSAQVDLRKVSQGYFWRRSIDAPSCWTMREAVYLLPRIGKSAAILDCGYGTGVWLCELAARGFSNVAGLEAHVCIDPDILESSISRHVKYNLIRGKMQELNSHETFSLVTYFDSLSNCLPLAQAIPALAGLVAPGGMMIFDFYVGAGYPGKHCGSPSDVKRICEGLGFKESLFLHRRAERDIAMYGMTKCR